MKESIILFFSFEAILLCSCEKNDGGIIVYRDPLIEFVDKNGTNLFASQTLEDYEIAPLDCEYRFIDQQGVKNELMLENFKGNNYVYYWTCSTTQKEKITTTAQLTSEYIFGDTEAHYITVSWVKTDDGHLHCTQFTLDGKDCDITSMKYGTGSIQYASIVTIVVDREK